MLQKDGDVMKKRKTGGKAGSGSTIILERKNDSLYFTSFNIDTKNIIKVYLQLVNYQYPSLNILVTKQRLNVIVKWYDSHKDMEPIKLAAMFYHLFIKAKPFIKENQYMAQVLLNTILVGHGFPPVVIPLERRLEFLTYKEVPSVFDIESIIRGQLDNSGKKKTYLKIL